MVFPDAFCPQRLREPINDERRIKFRPEPALYPVQITRAFAVMQATL